MGRGPFRQLPLPHPEVTFFPSTTGHLDIRDVSRNISQVVPYLRLSRDRTHPRDQETHRLDLTKLPSPRRFYHLSELKAEDGPQPCTPKCSTS
jgi:hypothetical protein